VVCTASEAGTPLIHQQVVDPLGKAHHSAIAVVKSLYSSDRKLLVYLASVDLTSSSIQDIARKVCHDVGQQHTSVRCLYCPGLADTCWTVVTSMCLVLRMG
jgi:hypothetical protein